MSAHALPARTSRRWACETGAVASMRAAVAERPGGPDGLVVREVPRPEPRPGWALVRVEAFGLNRSEYITLRGWSGAAVQFPRILGIECTGVVAGVAGAAAVVLEGAGFAERVRAALPEGADGEVDPVIDTVYALEEIADAHRRMAAGAAMGKLVVLTRPRSA